MEQVRYAKKDIYAEVEEESGPINRLVAAKGQPVPVPYVDLVDKADTQHTPLTEADVIAGERGRSNSARKQTPAPEEPDHEEFRRTAAAAGQTQDELADAKPKGRRRAASQPDKE